MIPSPSELTKETTAGPNSVANGPAARVVASIAIIGLAVWICSIYRDLFHGGASTVPKIATQHTAETELITRLLATDLSDGAWQIQGLDWNVGVAQCKSPEFAQRWAAPPNQASAVFVNVGLNLNIFVNALKPAIRQTGNDTVYEFQRANSRLQLWTSPRQGQEMLYTIRVALESRDEWLLYEIRPRSNEPAVESAATVANWVPLPPKADRLCRRFDGQSRIVAELWTFDFPLEELLLNWENSGWRPVQTRKQLVPLSPHAQNPTSPFILTLQNRSQQIFVWVQFSGPGRPAIALLTRAAEISPSQSP